MILVKIVSAIVWVVWLRPMVKAQVDKFFKGSVVLNLLGKAISTEMLLSIIEWVVILTLV